ncbi:tetratricopeptide repeat protein [Sorangium sp. So ce381]|uniref:tetratricopeptide repeat protein n=1 Tax=Sorangium sp. So ce381 TaxID=3133307 RepID=UPI003F5B23E7
MTNKRRTKLISLAQQGEVHRTNGNYTTAVQCFTDALAIDGKYAWAYAHRGAARAAIDDWANCCKDFETALNLQPGYGWAVGHWAEAFRTHAIYNMSGQSWEELHSLVDRSIELFDTAITLSPGSAWTFAHRGAAYTFKYWLDMMPKLAPKLGLDATHAARRTASPGESAAERARESFDKACQLNRRYAWAHAFKAILLGLVAGEKQGTAEDLDEARQTLLEALLFDVNQRLVLDRPLATLLHRAGDFAGSVAVGTSGLQKDPEDIVSRYLVTVGLKRLGDPLAPAVIQQTRRLLEFARSEIQVMLLGLDLLDQPGSEVRAVETLSHERLSVEAIGLVAFDPTWSAVRALSAQASGSTTDPVKPTKE